MANKQRYFGGKFTLAILNSILIGAVDSVTPKHSIEAR